MNSEALEFVPNEVNDKLIKCMIFDGIFELRRV